MSSDCPPVTHNVSVVPITILVADTLNLLKQQLNYMNKHVDLKKTYWVVSTIGTGSPSK
jgi:hypothetical protein